MHRHTVFPGSVFCDCEFEGNGKVQGFVVCGPVPFSYVNKESQFLSSEEELKHNQFYLIF